MSYVALATARFEEVRRFYSEGLGLPTLDSWDRPGARGCLFDLHGLRVEILDASRERSLRLGDPADRLHLVAEVADAAAERRRIRVSASEVRDTSWGARLFDLRDPDGVAITYMERKGAASERPPG